MQNFGKVAVLMGGFSSEREVSLDSGAAILAALKSKGVDAHAFDPKETPLSELKTQGFQTAFNILHGTFGEDGYSLHRQRRSCFCVGYGQIPLQTDLAGCGLACS